MNEKTKLPALINSLADLSNMGKVFAQSGMFKDAMDASKAIVKIMAGRELGIAPVLSMTKIHVVKGRITIGAEIMAGLVSGSGTHKYKITRHTNTQCDIEFYEKDNHGKLELLGVSSFGVEDAKRITHWDSKLGKKKSLFEGDNYQNYPQNMYFSRAMSNGCRWFVPHLIHGGYTPEEMGAEVIINEQGEQEVVIEDEPKKTETVVKVEPKKEEAIIDMKKVALYRNRILELYQELSADEVIQSLKNMGARAIGEVTDLNVMEKEGIRISGLLKSRGLKLTQKKEEETQRFTQPATKEEVTKSVKEQNGRKMPKDYNKDNIFENGEFLYCRSALLGFGNKYPDKKWNEVPDFYLNFLAKGDGINAEIANIEKQLRLINNQSALEMAGAKLVDGVGSKPSQSQVEEYKKEVLKYHTKINALFTLLDYENNHICNSIQKHLVDADLNPITDGDVSKCVDIDLLKSYTRYLVNKQ